VRSEQIESQLRVADQLRHLADIENEFDKRIAKYATLYSEFLSQKTVLDENLVNNQTYLFEDSVTDQQRLSVSTKKLLENRLDLLLNYQIAQQNLSSKANANSTEKLALEKQEDEQKLQNAKEKFEDMTIKVKNQVEDYKLEKSKLMRWALRELVRENIEYGEQVISSWKELGNIIETVK